MENDLKETRLRAGDNTAQEEPRRDDGIIDAEYEEVLPAPSEPGFRPEEYHSPYWVDIAAFIGVAIVAGLLTGVVSWLITRTTGATETFGSFIGYLFMMGAATGFLLWQIRRRGEARPALNFSLRRINPPLILWGVALVFIVSIVIEPLLNLFPDEYLQLLYNGIGTGGWAMLTTIVAAPLLEEILFRGLLQTSAIARTNTWKGLLIASAIFGVIHIIPQQAINAFFIGIILGYIYIRTCSLWPVIIIHALNNALSYIVMVIFEEKTAISTRELVGSDTWYWIIYALCSVLFVVAAVKLWTQIKRDDRLRCTADEGTAR